jgi:hypothetical protein
MTSTRPPPLSNWFLRFHRLINRRKKSAREPREEIKLNFRCFALHWRAIQAQLGVCELKRLCGLPGEILILAAREAHEVAREEKVSREFNLNL